jgi:putative tryptophan/tyrosine transport system substrate-binding protein
VSDRRQFITLLGGATAWPLVARAQQAIIPLVGYFSGRSSDSEELLLSSFRKGLEEEGFAIGKNVAIEYRFSDGNEHPLPAIAADFVRRQAAVIVASGTPSAIAAKSSTSTVPIVFSMGIDPVGQGLVASMNRPGGNATGVAVFTNELGPKRLELLRELVPKAELIAFIAYPDGAASPAQIAAVQAASQAVGQRLLIVNAATPGEIDQAFATIVQRNAGAILYSAHQFFQVVRDQLVALAARHRLPAMYEWREFAAAGGLVSYSTNRGEAFRQMGIYVGRILKGERPADLPVVQPTQFELVINLKTAKAIGLTVPPTLLVAADEVIE